MNKSNYASYKKETNVKTENENSLLNFGTSTKQKYSEKCMNDEQRQSTEPINYILDQTKIKNCNECFNLHGPRLNYFGYGNFTPLEQIGRAHV